MRTLKIQVNWGGYLNVEDEYEFEVEDDATNEEIAELADELYEEKLHENCSYEILDEDGDAIVY